MRWAKKWVFVLIVPYFLYGCSTLQTHTSSQAHASSQQQQNEIKPAATDVEGMLREGPGKYAGNKYDETKGRTGSVS
jgi:D-amino-acid dehydrogenase/Ca-activated chloride channel family protein